MRLDMRVRYDADLRRQVAALFEQGFGYHFVSKRLEIPKDTVREWFYKHRSFGLEGLLVMGAKQAKYTFEQKLSAVRAVVDNGATYADAMATYGIASLSPLKKWCRAYRKGGPEVLKPKPVGRPKGSKAAPKVPLTREQELEVKIRKLEAENAYLKKLEALRVEETLRTGSRPQW